MDAFDCEMKNASQKAWLDSLQTLVLSAGKRLGAQSGAAVCSTDEVLVEGDEQVL